MLKVQECSGKKFDTIQRGKTVMKWNIPDLTKAFRADSFAVGAHPVFSKGSVKVPFKPIETFDTGGVPALGLAVAKNNLVYSRNCRKSVDEERRSPGMHGWG